MINSKTQQIYSSSQPRICLLVHRMKLCISNKEILSIHVLSKLAPILTKAFTMVDKDTKNLLDRMLLNDQKNLMNLETSKITRHVLHLVRLNNNYKIKNGTSHLNPRWLEDGPAQLLLVSLDSVLHNNSTSNSFRKVGSNISHNHTPIKTLGMIKSTIRVLQTNQEILKVAIIKVTIRILVTTTETLMVGTNNRTNGEEISIDRVQMNNLVITEVEEAVVATMARHLWAEEIHEET